MTRRSVRAVRHAVLALAACGALAAFGTGSAHAGGRFGDSTWVAPAFPDPGDSAAAGPRVALPDRERGWESALRAPFRVAFYPLHLLGNGVEGGMGILGPRYLDPRAPHPPRVGPALSPAVHLGALNDIGIGPGLIWSGLPNSRGTLRASATWSAIDHRRAHMNWTLGEREPVGFRVRTDYDDKPDNRYYGVGNVSDVDNLSYFRLASVGADVGALLGSSPLKRLAFQGGYSAMIPERGSHASPLLQDVFAPAQAPFALRSTRDLWYGLAGDLASLDDSRNPSRGVHGRFDARHFVGMRSRDPDFSQWNLEGRAYVPVFARRRVIALRAVYAGVDPGRGAAGMPFYRLARSEDASRFAGYSSGRFRDRLLAHARIEYRWEVFHGASAIALYDAGEVQPRADRFRLRSAHTSYGGGLRMGLSDVATVRAELANSVEGLHAVLILGGDF